MRFTELYVLSCMSHMFHMCHVVFIWLLASIDPSFFHSELAADQEYAAKTSF